MKFNEQLENKKEEIINDMQMRISELNTQNQELRNQHKKLMISFFGWYFIPHTILTFFCGFFGYQTILSLMHGNLGFDLAVVLGTVVLGRKLVSKLAKPTIVEIADMKNNIGINRFEYDMCRAVVSSLKGENNDSLNIQIEDAKIMTEEEFNDFVKTNDNVFIINSKNNDKEYINSLLGEEEKEKVKSKGRK